jgi:hypothetical protein
MWTRYNAVSSFNVTLPHNYAVTLADLHSSAHRHSLYKQRQKIKEKPEAFKIEFDNKSVACVKPQGTRYEGQQLYNRLLYKNPVPSIIFILIRAAVSILKQFCPVQTRNCGWILVIKMKKVFCSVGCDVVRSEGGKLSRKYR